MGDCVTAQSQETDGEGEPFSFSKLFHDVEAYYISIGMTYEQFWHGDVWLAKVYRDAEELRERRANAEAWRNGFYMASALSSTVGNMFRKKGSSPIKYMDRPIPLTQKEKDEYEYQRAVEAQEPDNVQNKRLDEMDKRIGTLEQGQLQHTQALARDQRRFDEIDEVSRLTLDGVRNLLDAQLSGNNREGMQKSRTDIDNYLLKGVTNHGSTGN